MTAKQYLQNYRRIESRYNAEIEQLKAIENDLICLKSPDFSGKVKNSAQNDPIGNIVINLENEKVKKGINAQKYKIQMLQIQRQVAQMDETDNDYYVILLLRYILYKDWKFICEKTNMSRAQANIVHGRALQEFGLKFELN